MTRRLGMIGLKVKLAKMAMNFLPSKPTFDITHPRLETINHDDFLHADENRKKEILFEMAQSHYQKHQTKPFDHNFSRYLFGKILAGKKVLDLGCWCGGMAVSCAERWNVQSMYGMDVNEYFIEAARMFSSSREDKEIEYDFVRGFGESIPYEDDTFDAIISSDVFEHVVSLRKTLQECKRVLKPRGLIFTVFPSYYTLGEAHLSFVTRNPFIHWFFDSKILNIAYREILDSRGKEAYWYRGSEDNWKKLHGGIGINGTTLYDFRSIVKDIEFSKMQIIPSPLFSIGAASMRNPRLKHISKLLMPLVRMRSFQDYLFHRIVAILVV